LSEGHDLKRIGRIGGTALLFVPLDNADVESSLRDLKDNGTLWLFVRHTWIAHGGRGVAEAVEKYRQDCSSPGEPKGQALLDSP
jgi:hypothetical protein